MTIPYENTQVPPENRQTPPLPLVVSPDLSGIRPQDIPASHEEVLRLLENLQIHQYELEMQNAQLREAQYEIEHSRNRYADLFDFAPVGYFSVDQRSTIVEANLRGSILLGLDRKSLIGKPFSVFVAPSCRSRFWAHLYEVFKSKERFKNPVLNCDLKLVKRDKSSFDAILESVMGESSLNQDGHCRIAVLDVSERRRAESMLRLISAVVDTSHSLVIITDAELLPLYKNARVRSLFRAFFDEQESANPFEFFFRGAKNIDIKEVRGEVRAKGKWQGEVSLFPPLGRKISLRLTIKFLESYDTGSGHFIFIGDDISNLVATAEELQRAKETAEAASKTKTEFLAHMSHELRNPMNSLLGFTQILLGEEENPEKKEKLEVIAAAGGQLLHLLNDLLDISRIEAGKLEISHKPFSLYKLIKHIEQMFQVVAMDKKLALILELDEGLREPLLGDEHRIGQVFLNLIGNAFKFTEQGSIKVQCFRDPFTRFISFRVSDSGIGIPPAQLDRIFNAFEQGDASSTRRHQGAGLGLAIAKRIVLAMKGRISVQSQPGEGSQFHVELPLQNADSSSALPLPEPEVSRELGSINPWSFCSAYSVPTQPRTLTSATTARTPGATATPQPTPPRAPGGEDHKPFAVLIAEDNPVNSKLLLGILKNIPNIQSAVAENGAIAMERLGERPYDLLLLDMQMPVMDGIQVLHALRERVDLKHLHVIAITANALAGDQERYLGEGADDYLPKPIQIPVLIEKVRRQIQSKEWTQQQQTDAAATTLTAGMGTSVAHAYTAAASRLHPSSDNSGNASLQNTSK